jgi:GT2 family glycosyltransferase
MKLLTLCKNFFRLYRVNLLDKKYFLITVKSKDFKILSSVFCNINNLLVKLFVTSEIHQTRLTLLIRNNIEVEWSQIFFFIENNTHFLEICFYGDSVVKGKTSNWYESRPEWSPVFASSFDYLGEVLVIKSKLDFQDKLSEKNSFTKTIKELSFKGFMICKSNESLYSICEKWTSHVSQSENVASSNTLNQDLKLSVVIPTKITHTIDNLLAVKCINSLVKHLPKLVNLEVIVILNEEDYDKRDHITTNLTRECKLKFIKTKGKFNYSKSINIGVKESSNEIVLLLNDDIKFISKINIKHIFQHFEVSNLSIVGFNLVYPDLTIQHAGLEYREREPQHFLKGSELSFLFSSHFFCREVSGVTAACCFIRKSDFEKVGYFDESFPNDYNDVDLMIRLKHIEKMVILCNEIVAIHLESQTRGKTQKFEIRESLSRLVNKHGELPKRDPFLYTPFEINKVNNMELLQGRNLISG